MSLLAKDKNGEWNQVAGDYQLDETPTANSSNPVTSRGIREALNGKQDTLTFDNAPTANSDNMLTSGTIYTALSEVTIKMDSVPTEDSQNAITSGAVYDALEGKMDYMDYDHYPTEDSSNLVTSGGTYDSIHFAIKDLLDAADYQPVEDSTNLILSGTVYTALQGKQNTLTLDNAPTQNSNNFVTSGAIYDAIQNSGGGGGGGSGSYSKTLIYDAEFNGDTGSTHLQINNVTSYKELELEFIYTDETDIIAVPVRVTIDLSMLDTMAAVYSGLYYTYVLVNIKSDHYGAYEFTASQNDFYIQYSTENSNLPEGSRLMINRIWGINY